MPTSSSRSTGRQRAMAVMLLLAVAGAVIRWQAPQPSTLHDIGTLLLVLWLPAVGNLIAWLVRKLPGRPPRVTEFTPGSAFIAHLHAELAPTPEAAQVLASVDPAERHCTVIVGRQGFTARVERSIAAALQEAGSGPVAFEFLHPDSALGQLVPGKRCFVLVGTTAVATATIAPKP